MSNRTFQRINTTCQNKLECLRYTVSQLYLHLGQRGKTNVD
mgnify:CR=1 FL=1